MMSTGLDDRGRARWACAAPPRPRLRTSAWARWATWSPASRTPANVRVGDTVTDARKPGRRAAAGLPRGRSPWCSRASSPSTPTDFANLRDALDKLKLNDPAIVYQPETARGPGLRLPHAASSACSIWRWSRSASSASSVWTSSPQPPRWSTGCSSPTKRCSRLTPRRRCPSLRASTTSRSPYLNVKVLVPPDYVGAVMDLHHRPPRHVQEHGLPEPHNRSRCTGRCRSPSSSWTTLTS